MSSIFNMDNGNKIAIYDSGSNLYANTLPLLPRSQPMIIANDFSDSLKCCIHDKTLYYIYKNTANNLVLGSLPTLHSKVIFSDEALLFAPIADSLISCPQNILILTVSIKNPLNDTYSIDLLKLLPETERTTVLDNLKKVPEFTSFLLGSYLYFIINENENNKKARMFAVNMQTFITNPQAGISEIPAIISINPPCHNCKKLEAQIAFVTNQYNQLAETAKKIQEEGRLWKKLYEENLD